MAADTLPLPPALAGERLALARRAGPIELYVSSGADSCETRPLLLVHSINAAASAFEVRPLFERYADHRPVYAPDLPGYGFSDRSARAYEPALMCDALRDVLEVIGERHGDAPVDALALSLSCEFLARAACLEPERFASLALVSPTAMNGHEPMRGASGTTRGNARALSWLSTAGIGRRLFGLLTSRASIRYFLRRTFGSKAVPEAMVDYAWQTSHRPGAWRAPIAFLTGHLFSRDAFALYEALEAPVWLAHGTRGDFQDYRLAPLLVNHDNWSSTVFDSGALPHFECLDEVASAYEAFLAASER